MVAELLLRPGEAGGAGLEVFEEAGDLLFLFELGEVVFEGVGLEELVGEVGGFTLFDAGAQAVEDGGGVMCGS